MLLDTPVCDFGWKAPAFSLADADGRVYSFEDVRGEPGALVAFICNHCPYVHAIIDRLVADAKVLEAHGVGVVAIMSNDYQSYAADSPDKMKVFAADHCMNFPYLVD
jgi:peroxiredoxin